MSESGKKVKPQMIKCVACGKKYQVGAPHQMFCSARTCSECGKTFSFDVSVYDSRVKPPIWLCGNCLNERLDAEEAESIGEKK